MTAIADERDKDISRTYQLGVGKRRKTQWKMSEICQITFDSSLMSHFSIDLEALDAENLKDNNHNCRLN